MHAKRVPLISWVHANGAAARVSEGCFQQAQTGNDSVRWAACVRRRWHSWGRRTDPWARRRVPSMPDEAIIAQAWSSRSKKRMTKERL